jgi:nucleoside-diphosphate-sugar epimerase
MAGQKVVITGGSGFVGTNLVSFFSEQGWQVKNLDIAEPRNPEHLQLWQNVDLLDRERLIRETQCFEPTVFLHFGARTDLDERANLAGYAANIEGVCNVVDAIRGTPSIERAVFASSQLVCELGYEPKDDLDFRPSTLYGHSKVLSERIVRAADDLGAVWTIVRPTSLWGPWFAVPYRNFFEAISKGRYVHPRGEKTLKQWGYVGNAAYQIWKLIEAPVHLVSRKMFYLADYEPIELQTFANKVQEAVGARPIRTIPASVMRTAAILGDLLKIVGRWNPPITSFRYNNIVMSEIQNVEPLQAIVGPLPCSVDDGIEQTVQWLRTHGGI